MNSTTAIKQLKELDKLGNNMRLAAEKWDAPWKTLISTILSARTRDEVTIVVSEKLFERYKNVQELSNAKLSDVEKIITPVNFYKNKSKNIINCAKSLMENYNGNVPMDLDKLIELSGVGRKTANVFLAEEGGLGVGVDTHLQYCAQKLEWTKNKDPHKIELDLKKLFPKNYWNKVNPVCVRFGKTYLSRKKKDELLEKVNGGIK